MKKIIAFIRTAWMVLPFLLALYCYYPVFLTQANRRYPLLDAIYEALRIYRGFTSNGVEVGALLEIARYMALAAVVRILIALFSKAEDLVNWLKLRTTRSTVVYGDSAYAGYLFDSLPSSQRIRGGNRFIAGAARYLLMFSEDEKNIAFFHAHYRQMKDQNVYIMLNGVSGQNIDNPKITAFSIAENCARWYWRARRSPSSASAIWAPICFSTVFRST